MDARTPAHNLQPDVCVPGHMHRTQKNRMCRRRSATNIKVYASLTLFPSPSSFHDCRLSTGRGPCLRLYARCSPNSISIQPTQVHPLSLGGARASAYIHLPTLPMAAQALHMTNGVTLRLYIRVLHPSLAHRDPAFSCSRTSLGRRPGSPALGKYDIISSSKSQSQSDIGALPV